MIKEDNNIIPANQMTLTIQQASGNYLKSEFEQRHPLRHYANILYKRKWWVIGFFVSVVLTTGLIVILQTPIYRAKSVLQITQDNPQALMGERDPFSSLHAAETQGRFYETQYMILSSRPMAYKIIEALNLTQRPEFQNLKKRYHDKSADEILGKYADMLLENLEVKPLKRSYLVEVAFKSVDSDLAQRILNVISTEYTKFCMGTRRQSYALIKNWLEGELQGLARKVEESEARVYAHGQEKDFLSFEDTKENSIVSKFMDLNMLLTKAQSDRMLKEAQSQQIKAKGMDAPPITNNPLIIRLREEAVTQEAKVASLRKIYDEKYPQLMAERGKLQELNQRLNNEVKRIRTSIESDYGTALRAENFLQEAVDTQKSRVGNLQNNLVKHHILKRDMQTNEQLYQALLARMKETSVASTMVASNVAVITPAELPYSPYSPQKGLALMLSSFIGLFGGIGLAFLVEYFDDSIKSATELERICDLPTLGVVPLSRVEKGLSSPEQFSVLDQPNSLLMESIRQIRTALMLSSSGGPPGVVLVVSPNPGEGKTTISINLAISMAMNQERVLIIDADLRKPSVHRYFGQSSTPGLSNYLTGYSSLSEIIRPTEVPGFMFIAGGTVPPSPTELLSSQIFKDMLMELRKEFKHIIIDTPPMIEFADARILSQSVDGVLMVVKQHSTTRDAGIIAKQLFSQVNANLIGVVLNMATTNRLGYGTYYGYYKYYNKYYGKYISHKETDD